MNSSMIKETSPDYFHHKITALYICTFWYPPYTMPPICKESNIFDTLTLKTEMIGSIDVKKCFLLTDSRQRRLGDVLTQNSVCKCSPPPALSSTHPPGMIK